MYLPPRADDEVWLGVLIAIPEPWVSKITAARLELGDDAAQNVPAHITLIPPVAVKKDQQAEAIEYLQSVAASFRPFRVRIGGVGSFLPTSPVAYLEVQEGAPECAELADALRAGPLNYSPRFPYHPHVTLAQGITEEDIPRIVEVGETLRAEWVAQGFRLDSVDPSGIYNSKALIDFGL